MIRYPFVLLDADNTLFDFDLAEHKALNKVLTDRGYTPDAETVKMGGLCPGRGDPGVFAGGAFSPF